MGAGPAIVTGAPAGLKPGRSVVEGAIGVPAGLKPGRSIVEGFRSVMEGPGFSPAH